MSAMMNALIDVCTKSFSVAHLGKQSFVMVIKTGVFCRTVVYPLFPPLLMYQYIRQKDRDMYAVELLRDKAGTSDPKIWYDMSMPMGTGHWELQRDLKCIFAKVNGGSEE